MIINVMMLFCWGGWTGRRKNVNTSACSFKTWETLKQAKYCKIGVRKSSSVKEVW